MAAAMSGRNRSHGHCARRGSSQDAGCVRGVWWALDRRPDPAREAGRLSRSPAPWPARAAIFDPSPPAVARAKGTPAWFAAVQMLARPYRAASGKAVRQWHGRGSRAGLLPLPARRLWRRSPGAVQLVMARESAAPLGTSVRPAAVCDRHPGQLGRFHPDLHRPLRAEAGSRSGEIDQSRCRATLHSPDEGTIHPANR